MSKTSWSRLRPLGLLLLVFYGLWIDWVLILLKYRTVLNVATLSAGLIRNGVRFVLWGAFVIVFVRWIERKPLLAYLKLRGAWKKDGGNVVGKGARSECAVVCRHPCSLLVSLRG